MKVIGLTGGIGSGKTTVAGIFELLDVPVYNSDYRAKILLEENPEIKTAIENRFGKDIYLSGKTLDRKRFAKIIFDDSDLLKWVNSLVHPVVAMDFDIWKLNQKYSFVIKESAILIETLRLQTVDKIIVVTTTDALRISRVIQRNQITESDFIRRMSHQIKDDQRILFADYIIDNNGNKSIILQTIELFRTLRKFAGIN